MVDQSVWFSAPTCMLFIKYKAGILEDNSDYVTDSPAVPQHNTIKDN
jgi:hypothetical protein